MKLAVLYQPIVKWMDSYGSPKAEGIKSVLRVSVMMIIAWIIIQILDQIDLVPEVYAFKVWVFTFIVPVKNLLFLALTFAQKYIDKFIFEQNKSRRKPKGTVSTGLIPI